MKRLMLALLLAIGVSGIFTIVLAKRFMHAGAETHHLNYFALVKPMEAGDILKETDLKQISWPDNTPLQGALLKPAEIAGRSLLYPLAADEPILDHHLSAMGAGSGLSTRIPDGMRALSLKSDQVVGVAGFLFPGTHVDVLVTLRGTSPDAEPVTSTVLQDARILAAGQKLQPDPEGKATTVDVVTLLVSPQDAEKAVLASSQGTIHFVLRNGDDHAQGPQAPTQLSALGAPTPPSHPVSVAAAPAQVKLPHAPVHTASVLKGYTVLVTRGDKETPETFQ